ncbi:hypothetical protein BGX28_004092 [Mortierella sp. GBA30]|nr:hypothetical protein BGX28_004092 [Mortierella sp. GBA30]
MAPSTTVSQTLKVPDAPIIPTTTTTSSAAPITTTTTTTISSAPPIITTTTTSVHIVTTTSAAPIITTAPSAPVIVTTSTAPVSSAVPTTPATNTPCMSSITCGANQLCALQGKDDKMGICQAMVPKLCASNPTVACKTSADCIDPAFSYCAADLTHQLVCAGLGRPGTPLQCNPDGSMGTGNSSNNNSGGNSSLTNTLKYAGIAVGSVALLGIIFALVRWRRNKRQSSMPDFSEIDYGMSNRQLHHRSEPRSSLGAAAAVTGVEQSYPFSNRPNAGTAVNDHNQDGFYDDQYYDDQYAQMHPMAGMTGGAKMQQQQQGYYDQYDNNNHYDQQHAYDQQAYDQQYYKEAAAYGGYDQHGNYVGDGNYYDPNAAYGDYGQHQQQPEQQQQQYGANQVVPSKGDDFNATSPTVPVDAHIRGGGAIDQYGVEPSELDFGGTTNAAGRQGNYGRQY